VTGIAVVKCTFFYLDDVGNKACCIYSYA